MTIARQFYLLVCTPPLLAVAFAIGLSQQLSRQTAEGSRLFSTLMQIEGISQRLMRGDAEQIALVNQQVETPDPAFRERLRRLDYELGEACTAYQRLDIGNEERLAVERIKAIQTEIGLQAIRIQRDLAGGDSRPDAVEGRKRALAGLSQVHGLEADLREEFEQLNAAQAARIKALLLQLERTASQGRVATGALLLALGLSAAATALVLRRRVLRPVASILDASDRIRRGDLSARVGADRGDEVGRLIQGFDFMAESLANSYASLERKVEERTAALKKAQEDLLQAEKLSAMGLLVGGVAHELNNPLAAVVGFTELARARLDGQPAHAETLTLLKQVDAEAERCRRIVENLLQFARKREPRLEAFDLNAAVEQMLDLRAYALNTRGVRLVREYDPTRPIALADRHNIQQVALNLLNNAAEAIEEAGRPGAIIVRTGVEGDRVSFEFLDDGPGFREPARAFDPFYTTKTVGKGTGLGLSVCYGIVREHGGEITAENRERGAGVRVTLPAGRYEEAVAAVEAPLVSAQAPENRSRRRIILLVDDEPSLLKLQAMFVGMMGDDAIPALSAEAAITCLGEREVHAIVSDVRMPGMGGIAFYEWIGEHRPELLPRFLFTSGDVLNAGFQEFLERTGVPRISKPFRYETYRSALHGVLDGNGSVRG